MKMENSDTQDKQRQQEQHDPGTRKSFAAVRFKIERDEESSLLVQDIKIDKSQCASFNEKPISQHQSGVDIIKSKVTHSEKAENIDATIMKTVVIQIKKLTKKEIDAHSYAGKYLIEAKRKTEKKHKKHKKDQKHKNSLKLNSGNVLKDKEDIVIAVRKTTLTNETNSKKALSFDKIKSRSISEKKKGAISTGCKKVKMQPSISKPSTSRKRKKLDFYEDQLFYPPDRMVVVSSHTREKKIIKSDGKSSVSEANNPISLEDKSPAKDANVKRVPATTPGTNLPCGTDQNKNETEKKEVNTLQNKFLQSNSAQKKLATKSVNADTAKKERSNLDAERNVKVPEETEDSSDASSSLFSTDSSSSMTILELLFQSSSDSSPSEFEGF